MQLTVKDMIEYGYKWVGMIPLTEEEVLTGEAKDKTVYVLYPNCTEAEINTMIPYIGKGFMFGIERSETEIRLINKAIEELYGIKKEIADKRNSYEKSDYIMSGEREVWLEVLHILGFNNEDIDVAIEKAVFQQIERIEVNG